MQTKNKRLMLIKYSCKEDTVQRLKTCLDMCCIKYVIFKEYDFVGGHSLYRIYIDKNKCTWEQVITEVNRVKPVKFNYISNHYIENGKLFFDGDTAEDAESWTELASVGDFYENEDFEIEMMEK